jgi:quinol monooxygenase YgiN
VSDETTNNRLYALAQMTVHEGKEQAFREQAERVFAIVREKDKGTLLYEWYLSADGRHCTVIDSYENSGAVLAHMQNVGPQMKALMAMCDMKVDFLGTPSPQLAQIMRLGPERIKPRLQGLA